MKTQIVRIGNSRGVRIPKLLLQQTGLQGEVEIIAEDGSLVIRSVKRTREGWATAFQKMAQRGDDALIDNSAPTMSKWDEEEWEWR
jgi:antitoxin MazE